MEKKFFEERKENSQIKAKIVATYFDSWANIVISAAIEHGSGRIAYIDLYAGPGRYKDGSASTPLLVAQKIINNPRLHDHTIMYLNDLNDNNSNTLAQEISNLDGIEKLKFPPEITCSPVDEDAEKFFSNTKLIPSFTFFDPFGYKGLSLGLVKSVIKDWGCDCIFFFNYSRINAAITNPSVSDHMRSLFGAERLDRMMGAVKEQPPSFRESYVLEEMCQALKAQGANFVLPFRFKNLTGRLTHHLIFVSKHFRGFEEMKRIMTEQSSTQPEGVGSFAYSPADESMPLLFEFQKPLTALIEELPKRMAGQKMNRRTMYMKDSIDRPYLERHYTSALKTLEKDGKITVTSSKPGRKQGTFPDHTIVEFS